MTHPDWVGLTLLALAAAALVMSILSAIELMPRKVGREDE